MSNEVLPEPVVETPAYIKLYPAARNRRALMLLVFFQLLLLGAALINYLIQNSVHPAGTLKHAVILASFSASIVVNIFMAGRMVKVCEKEALLTTRTAMADSFASLAASMKAQNTDFTRHIDEMSRMADEDRWEELSAYVKSISRKTTALNDVLKVDNPIIGALLRAKAAEADVRDVRLVIDIKTSLAGLGTRALDIARIAGNLIDNAFDAVLSSEIFKKTVLVEIRRAGPLLQLEVSSEGPAIDTETAERIFKAGYTTKGEGHSGLGLHIVKTLVEKLDGAVTVLPDDARGTRFIVSLP
ncbi:MAG: ATP-binding protein [Bacillota bacterium]